MTAKYSAVKENAIMDEKRIKQLSGINEQDGNDMASYDRERHVETLIRHAFEKIGIEINYNNYSVNYDDAERTATVKLEESSVDLKLLNRLYESGLSSNYTIGCSDGDLLIDFIVAPELDHADIA
jgi:hypothetical protein